MRSPDRAIEDANWRLERRESAAVAVHKKLVTHKVAVSSRLAAQQDKQIARRRVAPVLRWLKSVLASDPRLPIHGAMRAAQACISRHFEVYLMSHVTIGG